MLIPRMPPRATHTIPDRFPARDFHASSVYCRSDHLASLPDRSASASRRPRLQHPISLQLICSSSSSPRDAHDHAIPILTHAPRVILLFLGCCRGRIRASAGSWRLCMCCEKWKHGCGHWGESSCGWDIQSCWLGDQGWRLVREMR